MQRAPTIAIPPPASCGARVPGAGVFRGQAGLVPAAQPLLPLPPQRRGFEAPKGFILVHTAAAAAAAPLGGFVFHTTLSACGPGLGVWMTQGSPSSAISKAPARRCALRYSPPALPSPTNYPTTVTPTRHRHTLLKSPCVSRCANCCPTAQRGSTWQK